MQKINKKNLFFFGELGLILIWTSYVSAAAPEFERNPFISLLPKPKVMVSPDVPKQPQISDLPQKTESYYPAVPALQLNKQEKLEEDIQLPALEISGVVWDSDRPQAVINGQVVDEGAVIVLPLNYSRDFSYQAREGGGENHIKIIIEKIEKTGISVSFKGKKFRVNL